MDSEECRRRAVWFKEKGEYPLKSREASRLFQGFQEAIFRDDTFFVMVFSVGVSFL